MDTNAKIIIGGLTTILAYDTVVHVINAKRFGKLRTEYLKARKLNKYLVTKLDDNHVPADEFDQIVLKNLQ